MDTASPEFIRFLRAAKAATYAAQGDDATVVPALPGSKQLEYRDGGLSYRDIYVGMLRFVGQEMVLAGDRALWAMSYAGGLADGVPREAAAPIYALLRAALLNAPAALPLRGPALLQASGMSYRCSIEGTLHWFRGNERIERDGAAVYELAFAGGSLA